MVLGTPRSAPFTRAWTTVTRDEAGPPGFEPGPTRLELVVLPLHHGPVRSGRPGSNGPPRAGDPVLFRLSYVRAIRPAGVEPATSALARQRSSPLSYGRVESSQPPVGVEPTLQPYKGRVLAVDTTEALTIG
jgi:hypothetical protein